jgi:hypothetical protein
MKDLWLSNSLTIIRSGIANVSLYPAFVSAFLENVLACLSGFAV